MAEGNIKPVVTNETLTAAVKDLIKLLIEEETCKLVHQMGRTLRRGEIDLNVLDHPTDEYGLVDAPGVDIFGQTLSNINKLECECPHCKKNVITIGFARHLEKCMGIGRKNSRIPTRRRLLDTIYTEPKSSSSSGTSSSSSINNPKKSKSTSTSSKVEIFLSNLMDSLKVLPKIYVNANIILMEDERLMMKKMLPPFQPGATTVGLGQHYEIFMGHPSMCHGFLDVDSTKLGTQDFVKMEED